MSARRRPARERPGFEDIRSSSRGVQEKPEWFSEARPTAAQAAGRRQEERRAQREEPRGRRKKSAAGEEPKAPRGERRGKSAKSAKNANTAKPVKARRGSTTATRERPRSGSGGRPRRKPMSLLKRRVLIVLTLTVMIIGTLFLAESLLLRVTSVQVGGDTVYPEAEVLRICGFKTGDNLLLIPAGDRERKLERELPYIAKAKISRKIPGTVMIELTAAKGICCIQSGSTWYVAAAGGKVLEAGAAPKEGLMQVIGVTPKEAKPGETMEFEGDEASTKVFLELLDAMDRLSEEGSDPAGEFTKMDLSDLYNIRLWYQDRVECRFGGVSQLEYKLRWAYGNLTNREQGIGPEESGVLDLSYLPTKKRSYFTPGEGSSTAKPTPGPDGIVPAASPTPGRGNAIPDAPFTGGSTSGGGNTGNTGGNTGNTGTGEDTGGDSGGYSGGDEYYEDGGGEEDYGDDTGGDTGEDAGEDYTGGEEDTGGDGSE